MLGKFSKIGEAMENEGLVGTRGRNRNFILFTIAVFASLTILGLTDNIRGTALPRIQEEFFLTELHLGLLLAANSTGYLTACAFTAALAKRIGMKACLIAGLVIVALAGICVCFSPGFAVLVLGFFILNIGFGMLDISTGVIAATIFTKRTGMMMNLAHFFYGAGATLSPVVSTGLMAARFGGLLLGWRYTYLLILSFALVPAIPTLIGRLKKQERDGKTGGYAELLKKPALWLLTVLLAFELVAESGTVAWLVLFLEKAHSFSGERAALRLTLFFICFTVSRLILCPFIDRIGLLRTLIIAPSFAGAMIIIGVLAGAQWTPLLYIAGIGVAPMFPTVMAVIAKLFPGQIDRAMTFVLTAIGIIVVPANFLIGGLINWARLVLTETHGEAGVGMAYSAGYLFLGLCCFAAFVFAVVLRARQKKAGIVV